MKIPRKGRCTRKACWPEPRRSEEHQDAASAPIARWIVTALLAGPQVLQQVMHHVVDFMLRERERVAVHRLFADGPVGRAIRSTLHQIQHEGSFAEADALVSDRSGAPTPTVVAAKRAADQASGRIGNGHVATPDAQMVIHQKIGGCWIAYFAEFLFPQVRGDSGFHLVSQGIVIGVRLAGYRLAARDVVARNNRASVAPLALLFHRTPGPRGVPGKMDVAIANDLYAFVASCQQNTA